MASKKDHTLCVTCHTELPPETELFYFSRESIYPTRDDTGFCEEVRRMIAHMEALFRIIGDGDTDNGDTIQELGRLGDEVAGEAVLDAAGGGEGEALFRRLLGQLLAVAHRIRLEYENRGEKHHG